MAFGGGHEGWVQSAAFSRDGTRVVTASSDRTARIWDAEGGTAYSVAWWGDRVALAGPLGWPTILRLRPAGTPPAADVPGPSDTVRPAVPHIVPAAAGHSVFVFYPREAHTRAAVGAFLKMLRASLTHLPHDHRHLGPITVWFEEAHLTTGTATFDEQTLPAARRLRRRLPPVAQVVHE